MESNLKYKGRYKLDNVKDIEIFVPENCISNDYKSNDSKAESVRKLGRFSVKKIGWWCSGPESIVRSMKFFPSSGYNVLSDEQFAAFELEAENEGKTFESICDAIKVNCK